MKIFNINSFDSVNDLLFEIYYRSEGMFDPAEDIKMLKDKKGSAIFTEEESLYLNSLMIECFIFCVLNDLNIYTLASMVQYDVHQVKASA